MTQDELLTMIYRARTPQEIEEARKQVESWVVEHPDDQEVRGTAELLIRTEELSD